MMQSSVYFVVWSQQCSVFLLQKLFNKNDWRHSEWKCCCSKTETGRERGEFWENWFSVFQGKSENFCEEKKKIWFRPEVSIMLKRVPIWKKKKKKVWKRTVSSHCNGEVLLNFLFMFKCFLNLPRLFYLIYPAAVNSTDDALFPKVLLHLSAFSERKWVAYLSHPCSLFSSIRL